MEPVHSQNTHRPHARLAQERAAHHRGRGTTVGGTIGVRKATITLDKSVERVQAIIEAECRMRKDIIFLSHSGRFARPEEAAYANERMNAIGFVADSGLERLAFEDLLTQLTQRFKTIPVRKDALKPIQQKRPGTAGPAG
ncbi:MAG: phosphoenolpyruvate hydrolase family protein [Verrucomicrobia bacterium]|nr:phosphoenolpyruvate hydrolase family protein [Verrucomicrobiota bacterium]